MATVAAGAASVDSDEEGVLAELEVIVLVNALSEVVMVVVTPVAVGAVVVETSEILGIDALRDDIAAVDETSFQDRPHLVIHSATSLSLELDMPFCFMHTAQLLNRVSTLPDKHTQSFSAWSPSVVLSQLLVTSMRPWQVSLHA